MTIDGVWMVATKFNLAQIHSVFYEQLATSSTHMQVMEHLRFERRIYVYLEGFNWAQLRASTLQTQ